MVLNAQAVAPPIPVVNSALTCRQCHVGRMVKLPSGWTCEKCGFAPFGGPPREKVAPPAPVVAREPLPEQVMAADFKSAPAAPPVLFSTAQRPPGSTHMLWADAGSGVRYAVEVPLQLLPPGEPVDVRVLVENQGPYVVRAAFRFLQNGSSPGSQGVRSTTGDLPVGTLLDTSYAIKVPASLDVWKLALLCQPLPPTGAPQNPWKAPDLRPDTAAPPTDLPTTHATVAFRATAHCPRCGRTMRWVPARPPKPRAWVCESCAHRVETGFLD